MLYIYSFIKEYYNKRIARWGWGRVHDSAFNCQRTSAPTEQSLL